MSILAYPFHVLASILRFVFQALRIPLPNIPFSSLSFSSLFSAIRAPPVDPYTESDRWVRQLEEETGATRRGHSPSSVHDEYEYDDAAAAGASGSIGLRSRRKGENDGVRGVLPDFWIGSYEDALRMCRDQYRIACIVLVSAEHDDTLPFKRDTLTDPALVDVLTKENILVWGADTRGREGWSASHKLGATTSPFVAFIALQPPRGTRAPTTTTSTPTMTVLSRHSGLTSTRAPALLTHLTTHLLPRVTPFLTRLRVQAEERALERRLRDEQDARFAESARRDREKAEAARVEEARKVEREEEERRGREEAERKRKEVEKVKEAWRGAGRNAVVRRVEEGGKEKGGVRVGIRFPDGARVASAFDPSEPILALFCVVDAHLHLSSSPSQSSYPPSTKAAEEDVQALMTSHAVTPDDWFGFKIFTSYPRREISFGPGRTVGSEGVEGSVSVELVSGGVGGKKGESEKGDGEGSDGYETEDE